MHLFAISQGVDGWSLSGQGLVARGIAALTIDGPGQGETSLHLPIPPEWGRVIGAVIDVLERGGDPDGRRVGVVAQSLAKTTSGPTELVVYLKAILSVSTLATNTAR